ncbi:MAG TPA: phosphatidate cytidylyltransferase [Prolixibacteraceae bacterium]|nr:phosphatidate cytidylyltransferase [Prolixibacteraceae bacterium]
MIRIIYTVIFIYFILGAIGFYFINRNKSRQQARQNWIKFGSYFVIIHLIFVSIIFNPVFFRYLSVVIIAVGAAEIIFLYKKEGFRDSGFFALSTVVFAFFSLGLFLFSGMKKELILYVFLILSIFDSFSQISGQLWGKTKLFPKISPNKTAEGLVGGAIVAIASTFLLKTLTGLKMPAALFLATGVVVFAFLGDAMASVYKRKYNAKDFSRMIPGHGGFLDRFDSLIAAGAWTSFSFALTLF